MKRRFSLVLAVVLAVALVAVIPFATGAFDQETQIGDVEEGYTPSGTAIHNATEFANMTPDGNYYLANDIKVEATYAADFTGKLDGNGKIITTTAPLFKNLKGEVKNLKITGTVNVSDYDAGALAQRADGATVSNVLNHANVTGAKAAIAEEYIFTNVKDAAGATADSTRLAGTAGIVGSATGVCSFTDCMNLGAINGSPAGGIVGVMGYAPNDSSFTFINCYNEGTISDNGCSNEGEPNPQGEDRGVAGIAGFAMDAKTIVFENCHNTGDIDASFADDGGSKAAKTVTGGIFSFVSLAVNTNSNSATLTVTGCTNNAVVKGSGQTGGIVGYNGKCNMTVKNCENKADAEIISTASYIGGVVGRSDGTSTIENCSNYGSVFSAASGNMGGICGYMANNFTIKGCTNYADIDVTASAGRPFGGIFGASDSSSSNAVIDYITIEDCKNLGDIKCSGRTGGIAADGDNSIIKNCINEGNIVSTADQNGGIAGRTYSDSIIENCVNTGNVSTTKADGDGKSATAGIVGYVNTNIEVRNCVNNGDISAPKNAVGGIVGNINFAGTIDGCLNTGNINGGQNTGGIVGHFGTAGNKGKEIITRCGNTGNVTGTGSQVGAIVAYVYGGSAAGTNETVIMYCYSTGTITGATYVGAAIGYTNSGAAVAIDITYNFFAGSLVTKSDSGKTFIVYNKQKDAVPKHNIEHNYYPEGYAALEEYLPGDAAGKDKSVAAAPLATAASFASGEIAFKLNAAIKAADATITEDVFFQTLGTDTYPVLDNTHKAVLKLEDGSYANELPTPPVEPEDTTTEEETTTATPSEEETTTVAPSEEETTTATPSEEETTTVAPSEEETTTATPSEEETTTATPSEEETTTAAPSEEETTAPTPTDTEAPADSTAGTTVPPYTPDDGPVVGDSIATVITVIAIAIVAIASTVAFIVIKKKEN